MGDGGRFRGMIVAHEGKNPAMGGGSRRVCMAEHIARPVYAGTLAVPERKYAVIAPLAQKLGLLRTPTGRCRQILVQTGLKGDIGCREPVPGLPELLVDSAERRAPITGYKPGGVQPGAAIKFVLHQQQSHNRLRAGNEYPFFGEVILVIKRYMMKHHCHLLAGGNCRIMKSTTHQLPIK